MNYLTDITFANMRNGSALVVWPWDAVPSTVVVLKLVLLAAAFLEEPAMKFYT